MSRTVKLQLLVLCCLPSPAMAEQDAQLWTSMSVTAPLGSRFEVQADANMRWYDNATDMARVQVRGMLAVKLGSGVLLGGGYSYIRNEEDDGSFEHEDRVFQQLSLPLAKIGKAQLVGRTRMEQRMYRGEGTVWRFRQQVRLNIPLQGPEGLRFSLSVEPLFLLNQPDAEDDPTGFDEFRTAAAVFIPLAGRLGVEVGYLNQYSFPGENEMNHILNIGFSARF